MKSSSAAKSAPDQAGSAAETHEARLLERRQARLLALLREAGGRPVSYAELRNEGIAFPATIVTELELTGVPVERCYGPSLHGRRLLGVRLDPARDDWDHQPAADDQPSTGVAAGEISAPASVDPRQALPRFTAALRPWARRLAAAARRAWEEAVTLSSPRSWLLAASFVAAIAFLGGLAFARLG